MFLGMDVETLNQFELFGMAGGVSFMLQNDEGKQFIKKMSDLSYMANQFIWEKREVYIEWTLNNLQK